MDTFEIHIGMDIGSIAVIDALMFVKHARIVFHALPVLQDLSEQNVSTTVKRVTVRYAISIQVYVRTYVLQMSISENIPVTQDVSAVHTVVPGVLQLHNVLCVQQVNGELHVESNVQSTVTIMNVTKIWVFVRVDVLQVTLVETIMINVSVMQINAPELKEPFVKNALKILGTPN